MGVCLFFSYVMFCLIFFFFAIVSLSQQPTYYNLIELCHICTAIHFKKKIDQEIKVEYCLHQSEVI